MRTLIIENLVGGSVIGLLLYRLFALINGKGPR